MFLQEEHKPTSLRKAQKETYRMMHTLKDSFIITNIKSELNKISSLILCNTDISAYGLAM